MPLLLILGTIDDPHVRSVEAKVASLGVSTIVVDHNERALVTILQSATGALSISVDGQDLELDRPDVLIWNRQKLRTTIPFFFPKRTVSMQEDNHNLRLSNRSLSFLASEWRAVYRLFLSVFERHVVNSPTAVARISNKLVQQLHAAAAGFQVPPSIIANDQSTILEFLNDYPEAIIKRVGTSEIVVLKGANEDIVSLMTMVVRRGQIESKSTEEFQLAPSFVQQKISKAFELRVVVVGESLFAFKIASQDYKLTSTDWRYGNFFLRFEPFKTNDTLDATIRDFMKRSDLFAGSIDLIVDKDNTVWFLEVNQEGAWAWLDPLIDGEISDAFAHAFAKHLRDKANSTTNMVE